MMTVDDVEFLAIGVMVGIAMTAFIFFIMAALA